MYEPRENHITCYYGVTMVLLWCYYGVTLGVLWGSIWERVALGTWASSMKNNLFFNIDILKNYGLVMLKQKVNQQLESAMLALTADHMIQ